MEVANEVVAAERLLFTVRGHRVLLDSDLARIYGVSTKRFNQAVKRNLARFPADFAFRLTADEFASCGPGKPLIRKVVRRTGHEL